MYYKKPAGKHRAKTHKRFTNDKEKKNQSKPLFKKIISYKKNSKKEETKDFKIIRKQ